MKVLCRVLCAALLVSAGMSLAEAEPTGAPPRFCVATASPCTTTTNLAGREWDDATLSCKGPGKGCEPFL